MLVYRLKVRLVRLAQHIDGVGAHQRIHRCHDVLGKIKDTFEVSRRQVQQQPEAARDALGEPNVRDRSRQIDVAHALTADLGARHFHTAAVADDPAVADLLVLAAEALPVLRRTEDALTEQAVLLGPERSVVDRLRLGDLTVRPLLDLFRRCQRDTDGIEVCRGCHTGCLSQRGLPASPNGSDGISRGLMLFLVGVFCLFGCRPRADERLTELSADVRNDVAPRFLH